MQLKPLIISIIILVIASSILRFSVINTDPALLDDKGYPYLQDWDSYKWYQKANAHDLESPIAYISYYWWRFLKFFDKDITLMGAMSYLPIPIMAIVTINIFFIIFIISNSYMGSFLGSSLFIINRTVFISTIISIADNQLLIFLALTFFLIFYFLLIRPMRWKDTKVLTWKMIYLFILILIAVNMKGIITHNSLTKPESYNNVIEQISYGFSAIFFIDHYLLVLLVMGFAIYYLAKENNLKTWSLVLFFLLFFTLSMYQIRFVNYAVVFYCILAGIGMDYLYRHIKKIQSFKYLASAFFISLFMMIMAINLPSYFQQAIIADDGTAGIGKYIPKNAIIINYWPSGYMIKAFAMRDWIRFEGRPSSDYQMIEGLVSNNENFAVLRLKDLGKNPYLILTQQDIEQIKFIYDTRSDSVLNKLVMNRAEHFEQVYRSESDYNWIAVWKVK